MHKVIVPYFLAGLLFITSFQGHAQSPIRKKPNIIFILADDLGWKDVGFQGNKVYETPNLDKLASEGLVFTQAYMMPTCSPSRAALMSGMYPPSTGIYTVDAFAGTPEHMKKLETIKSAKVLDSGITTIAEMLKPAGYQSATIGKWHLGKDPLTQGFDYNIGGSLVGSPASYFYPYKGKNSSSHDIRIDGGSPGEYLTERLANEAEKMIKKMKEKPFFLYMPFYSVHVPLQAREDKITYFSKKITRKQFNPIYAAMISSLDEAVGKVLKAVEENGLAKNTMIIFVSDNGGQKICTSNEPLRGQKGNIYEGGIRVPMIVKLPGITPKSGTCDVPVTVVDFFPTIAELAHSQKHFERIDGLSLVPLLKGEKSKVINDRAIFWHLPGYNGNGKANANIWQPPCSAIRQGDWKLIEFFEDGHLELYNLKDDISETTNLATTYPSISQKLLKKLKSWQKTSNAPIPNRK